MEGRKSAREMMQLQGCHRNQGQTQDPWQQRSCWASSSLWPWATTRIAEWVLMGASSFPSQATHHGQPTYSLLFPVQVAVLSVCCNPARSSCTIIFFLTQKPIYNCIEKQCGCISRGVRGQRRWRLLSLSVYIQSMKK